MNRFFVFLLLCIGLAPAQDNDVILRAMHDELEHSRMLRVTGSDAPYFFEYRVTDARDLTITATLGGILAEGTAPLRLAEVNVRAGDYNFDNTNYVFSEYYSGTRYDTGQLPLDDDYWAIRQSLWLATDRAYKTAIEAIGHKHSALQNVNVADPFPDFTKAPPLESIEPRQSLALDEALWSKRVVAWSKLFAAYPALLASGVEFQAVPATSYLVNSEGTTIRKPDSVAFIRLRAFAQAPDGMLLRDAEVFHAIDAAGLPSDAVVRAAIARLAERVTALSHAPTGTEYIGPVLFEPQAAAQLFAQLVGDNLKVTRKPVAQPGRPVSYLPSEFENRTGSRILPEWIDVTDDPALNHFGHFTTDDEGVQAQRLPLIEKGILKNFLLTRTPVSKDLKQSNGRARLHGNFGAMAPGFGNLVVSASQTVSTADLKARLIKLVTQREKPYGILVRKLDFPSSASYEELRQFTTAMAQSGGGARPSSLPLLVYRVYPDGHEELVRGVRFRGLSTRSLRDIIAASSDSQAFDFLDSTAPFALMGAGSYITNATVVAPGLLIDELELEPSQEELPKLPLVPPPPPTEPRR